MKHTVGQAPIIDAGAIVTITVMERNGMGAVQTHAEHVVFSADEVRLIHHAYHKDMARTFQDHIISLVMALEED